mmetsp:Transcript_19024/g.54381  ORF Transcript_19024/g.54381 Transcript_19024/m.54381 type:complete len:244 (-) Transcript_19024:55-786(-)
MTVVRSDASTNNSSASASNALASSSSSSRSAKAGACAWPPTSTLTTGAAASRKHVEALGSSFRSSVARAASMTSVGTPFRCKYAFIVSRSRPLMSGFSRNAHVARYCFRLSNPPADVASTTWGFAARISFTRWRTCFCTFGSSTQDSRSRSAMRPSQPAATQPMDPSSRSMAPRPWGRARAMAMHFLQAPWRGCWQDGASSSSLVRGVAQMAQGVVGAADRSKPPRSLASRTWAAILPGLPSF